MPGVVRDEVVAVPAGTTGLEAVHRLLADGRVQVLELVSADGPEPWDLDAGEAAAIRLAEEIEADVFLCDDGVARAAAHHRGIPVVGTVGILTRARDQDFLAAAYPLLLELRHRGQWLSDELLRVIREQEQA